MFVLFKNFKKRMKLKKELESVKSVNEFLKSKLAYYKEIGDKYNVSAYEDAIETLSAKIRNMEHEYVELELL